MAPLTPQLLMTPRQEVTKLRELPLDGNILVTVGQQVKASDIVAEALLPGDLALIHASDELGVGPGDLARAMRVAVGQQVVKGELLATQRGPFGLFTRQVVAPVAGTLEFVNDITGSIGLRANPRRLVRTSYIAGKVTAIEARRSVTVTGTVALIQGIFGVGGERLGVLHPLACATDAEITAAHLPADATSLVLCGGMSPAAGVLQEAAKRGAVGFICGSIDAAELRSFIGRDLGVAVTGDEEISMSIMVTEGFGAIPMSAHADTLMRKGAGRSVSLNGTTQVRAGAVRPELLICDGVEGPLSSTSSGELSVGSRVRFIRYPLFGHTGEVIELPFAPEKLETGSLARVLRARLPDGSVVTVPRANIELV